MDRKRVGYVKVVEATDEYDTFVTNINAATQEAFDLGIGILDIKYQTVVVSNKLRYSAMLIFDDQRKLDPEP